MTTDSATQPPTPQPPPPPVDRPRLTRPREGRVVAGVCAGLGRYTGIDPVVYRVVLAVLVLFGGVGALLYALGWLLLPEDGDDASPIEALLGRGRSQTSPLLTVLLAVLAAIALGFAFNGHDLAILALAVIGLVLLARHRGAAPAPTAEGGRAPLAPRGPYAASSPVDAGTGEYPGGYPGSQPWPSSYQSPAPPLPRAPARPRSRLGLVAISVTLVEVGLLVGLDRSGALSISAPAVVAVALGMVGAALVLGAWLGRARWLIAVGVVLALLLGGLTATADVTHGSVAAGNRTWTPATVSGLSREYRLGVGDATLDLSAVDFAGRTARTAVRLGAGDLMVRVPANVDVTVHASTGAGRLQLFDYHAQGTRLRHTGTDLGADGEGGGALDLSLSDGLGTLEVTRD